MSNQQAAEAIFDKLYEDVVCASPEAEMLNKLFRHVQVKKIREVLEKCQQPTLA